MGHAPWRQAERWAVTVLHYRPHGLHQAPGCPGIEGLRAIAACSVLVYHCWRYSSADHVSPRLGPFTGIMPHLALG